ncbi:HAD family hydrolase [Corynebacterium hylobatis]|uniref:HAD family hydrolase n=1 Tax=Corynebacterium hylobatis TaxID=1859290 RepID=A0A430I1K4_9CORY|nr:HAD family hydrolase [Corynebacterium hylobatis]RSZ65650.1 HAD family hydrolase [Corynebacterium hylobatis]
MEFRLIALDMDGTLLDPEGRIPDTFWEVLTEARSRGIAVAPASGRQLATLRSMFPGEHDPGTFIAENGTCVFHEGGIVSTTLLNPTIVRSVIAACGEEELDLVVCTPDVAYHLPTVSETTRTELQKYYVSREQVPDLLDVADADVIKLAIFTSHDAEEYAYPPLRRAAPDANVVVSGAHWVDIMSAEAGKGRALTALAEELGVEKHEILAFGDYLNDLELLQAAGTAYAMENAHPEIRAIAHHIAPPNTEAGVVTVLRGMLGM